MRLYGSAFFPVLGLIAVLISSCSSPLKPSEKANNSEMRGGVGAGKNLFAPPSPKSPAQMVTFGRHLVTKSFLSRTGSTTSLTPRTLLRQSLYSGIMAHNGVPRRQIAPALKALVDPSSSACGGASCARVFGLKPREVEAYLDECYDVASRDKRLAQPQNEGARRTILSSLIKDDVSSPFANPELKAILATVKRIAETETKFLAYGFASTGCDYRAFYMAMAVATEQIAPKAYYNSARTGFKLMPTSNMTWEYHVATAFTVGDQEFILDPTFKVLGLAHDLILPKDQWLKLSGPRKQGFWDPSHGTDPSREFYFPGSFSLLENLRVREQASTAFLDGDELLAFRSRQESIRKGSFDDLPRFTMKDINEACRNMTFLLFKENPASADLQKGLIAHTQDLIAKLEALGKLDRNAAFQCSIR